MFILPFKATVPLVTLVLTLSGCAQTGTSSGAEEAPQATASMPDPGQSRPMAMANPDPDPGPDPDPASVQSATQQAPQPKTAITRYISATHATVRSCPRDLTGMYAQIFISADDLADGRDKGNKNDTHPQKADEKKLKRILSALFGDKVNSTLLSANIELSNPKLSLSVPLVALYHEKSLKKGNMIDREINIQAIPGPYFRLEPQTKLETTLDFKEQDKLSSRGVGMVLNILKQSVKALDPGSALLTDLSKDSVREESNIIDNAISSLFSSSVAERIRSGATMSIAENGQDIVATLTLDHPDNEEEFLLVGRWKIGINDPRVSMFATQSVDLSASNCGGAFTNLRRNAFTGVTASRVMNFKLAPNTTIATVIHSQDWYTQSVAKISSTTAATKQQGYADMCSKVVEHLTGLGLNDTDAAASLWAVVSQLPLPIDTLDELGNQTSSVCAKEVTQIRALGLMP
ncbi:MAG: hypothetical protein OQK24_00535 [Magnetovibrio sp.]|nr:hypothetical protein [Magnetovibrio sp.]